MSRKKQDSTLSSLQRAVEWTVKNHKKTCTLFELNQRLDNVQVVYKDAVENQSAMEEITADGELKGQFVIREQLEEYYINATANLYEMIDKLKINAKSSDSPPFFDAQPVQDVGIKIPTISLPTFDGDYKKWTPFIDLFNSLIDNKASLSNAEKLHYLKSNLTGEAKSLIQSFQICDANYAAALKLLKNRYNNKRFIIDAHIDAFLAQSKLSCESAVGLKTLHDVFNESMRSLQALGIPTTKWDAIIVHIMSSKLDHESRRQWELSISRESLPTFIELSSFIETRWQSLEMVPELQQSSSTHHQKSKANTRSFTSVVAQSQPSSSDLRCPICSNQHSVFKCESFMKQDIDARFRIVRDKNLCLNCFKSGHWGSKCSSAARCRICKRRHHTLLHYQREVQEFTPASNENASSNQSTKNQSTHDSSIQSFMAKSTQSTVLLATAMVIVQGRNNVNHRFRALIDSGSESSFITEDGAKRLGLPATPTSMKISGIANAAAGNSTTMLTMLLFSRHDPNFALNINALILPSITGLLPANKLPHYKWPHVNALKLADPFYYMPKTIDLLLGADVLGLCLREGQVSSQNGSPFAQNTSFGYILFGHISSSINCNVRCVTATLENTVLLEKLDKSLKSFWEIEEIHVQRSLTPSELRCEEHFGRSHYRRSDGRFVVSLPFKEEPRRLGNSRMAAIIRLNAMERKFVAKPRFKQMYVEFMKDYLSQGHMEPVIENTINHNAYYMPHHGVLKTNNGTSKLRVVFDASCQTTTGVSLNDNLLIGHKILHDITAVIMRWRLHKLVFMADIKQMYRQIMVKPSECDYQRIVWRESPTDPIVDYRLLTVTYGTSCAPFLAIRTLQQLANESVESHPLGAKSLLENAYVDDIMVGSESSESLLELKVQLVDLLQSAGLELRKWSSNDQRLLSTLPADHCQHQSLLAIKMDDSVKALGISWCPISDCFCIHVELGEPNLTPTKRNVLSESAKLFDPFGWLAPCIIVVKMLFQELWQLGVDWDDVLPSKIAIRWLTYRQNLQKLQSIKIPRWLGGNSFKKMDLFGFCDASTVAYAAVVYSKLIDDNGNVHMNLLTAKTKVAPIQTVSLPRLELCGANLLARLLNSTHQSVLHQVGSITAFCDSQVALSWLKGNPTRWQTFVANRVIDTIKIVPPTSWQYVSTSHNPADCASRGLSPAQLNSFHLWWHGPSWLKLNKDNWPKSKFNQIDHSKLPETRRIIIKSFVTSTTTNHIFGLLQKCSSMSKLLRVTSWCKRFIYNARILKSNRQFGTITADEIRWSQNLWIKFVQADSFHDEISRCLHNETVLNRSKLRSLHPFVDGEGVLRVTGRLANSLLPYSAKYPIILPKNSSFTKLIIKQIHLQTLHGGQQLVLSTLYNVYWILGAKSLVRQHIHNCITCFRYRASCRLQLMGQLPSPRVTPSRAFLHTGVDFAGPILIKRSNVRNAHMVKTYIAVFVCLATKAIHLELASDLSTSAFIAAYQRFVARRGKCVSIYSDCGTNFVGADAELNRFLRTCISQSNTLLANVMASDLTTWKFIPPGSPHFGGLWEAGVKSVKHHLRRTMGNARLSFEELTTTLAQIEACLNSRPLCPLTNDVNDCNALTPGHFLIGEALLTVPYPNILDTNIGRLNRWQMTQQLFQRFWHQWSSEYLRRLQQRPKWTSTSPNLEIGQLVLVSHENLSPSKWPLARVSDVHPGADGLVRVVSLRCGDKTMKRNITKVCPLPSAIGCSPPALQGGENV